MLKRLFDITFSAAALIVLLVPLMCIALAVRLTSRGPILFWSDRVGQNNVIFKMPKFRSMRIDAPNVATHLLKDPERHITPVGKFIRKTSLDELPQLWSIIVGNMSIVGPRPALYNQDDLVSLRTQYEIHKLKPGLTGLAQIEGRDELSIADKVELDLKYSNKRSFVLDLTIILKTISALHGQRGVHH